MLEKANTILLLIVFSLLVYLILQPQAGRYQRFSDSPDDALYLLDTATGKLVIADAENAVRKRRELEDAARERKAAAEDAAVEEWRERNCSDVLAGRVPESLDALQKARLKQNPDRLSSLRQDCEEWQQSKSNVEK
jgi:hypothetical protein